MRENDHFEPDTKNTMSRRYFLNVTGGTLGLLFGGGIIAHAAVGFFTDPEIMSHSSNQQSGEAVIDAAARAATVEKLRPICTGAFPEKAQAEPNETTSPNTPEETRSICRELFDKYFQDEWQKLNKDASNRGLPQAILRMFESWAGIAAFITGGEFLVHAEEE